jgi:hypothetical protein
VLIIPSSWGSQLDGDLHHHHHTKKYVANVSIILMLHACFTPIALCFIYTSCHFYAFSGTNLLTRCHSASSYYLLFFYSRFLLKEIFSELDETKSKVPIFLIRSRSPKGRRCRAMRRPHLVVARAPWPRRPMAWAPWAPTNLALSPIYSHPRENPKHPSLHP